MIKLKYKVLAATAAAILASSAVITSCCFLPDDDEKLDLSEYELYWCDEFDGSSLDTDTWNEQVWASGKVNNEVQSYAAGHATIVEDDEATDGSVLRLTATSSNGSTWVSSRIDTATNFNFKYGYVEARIKMPVAYDSSSGSNVIENKGVWPAFWMMPENVYDDEGESTDGGVYGVWPRSGELDIMEYSPSTSGEKTYSTIHHATSKTDATDSYSSLGDKTFDNPYEWHTYGLLWTSGTVEAYYDGQSLGTIYANTGNNWAKWPYDQNFYIILNLAMGGTLGGSINSDMRRAEYDIDYVRVYKAK
ncbi:glycoside hydrolase family 16 protein [Treponema sp.]|uniref:glycoside hydrolase family 16 protein n=1 Tax=Treponema sp. TaxID=166 RepID=UPI0025FFBDC4|nr:glycoside hydrolase family 16 protein [Treponema sp.]MCR5217359.1 glycoside hydrolase family 16 protein [Treponema sp.]